MYYYIQLDIEMFNTRYYGIVHPNIDHYDINWTAKIDNATPLTLGQANAAKLFAKQSNKVTIVTTKKARMELLLGIKE
jgi:hypothetical protein